MKGRKEKGGREREQGWEGWRKKERGGRGKSNSHSMSEKEKES